LSAALAPWRKPLARHDPGKVIADLAIALALGGDCLADVALLRAEPAVFGAVASDPTVSRTIDALAADSRRALAAIDTARATARARVWRLAGEHAPDHDVNSDRPPLSASAAGSKLTRTLSMVSSHASTVRSMRGRLTGCRSA